jgi:hypothetical protein
MKKLQKLTLKELSNSVEVIDETNAAILGGGSISTADWNSMSDDNRAQYIIDAYRNGEYFEVEGMSAGGWQTDACGANVTVNGVSYTVIVSISSLPMDFSQMGYEVKNDYQNPCDWFTKITVGNNAQLMLNPLASQSDDFIDNVLDYD